MKKIISYVTLFFLMQSALHAQANDVAPNIIPAVRQWRAGRGYFIISASTEFRFRSSVATQRTITLFREDLNTLQGRKQHARTKLKGAKNYIVIKITPEHQASQVQKESYQLEIKPGRIIIKANDDAGVFYATRTLLQLIEQGVDKRTIPCYTISDTPAYRFRGFMLDVGRKFFPISQLKDYICRMSWYKMNQLQLHFNDQAFHGEHYSAFRIESKTYPQLTAKDGFYTQREIKELIQYAAERGINIIPEIDAPAHAMSILDIAPELKNEKLQDGQLDVLNPQTINMMEKIYDEFVPLFPSPYFHIGTDEYRFKKAATTEDRKAFAAGFCDYINHFNKYIRGKGKQVMIWSGYNQMAGFTPIDSNIVIDMWLGKDAKEQINEGHQIIHSTDEWLYIVPGANYYGVDNKFLYEKWMPNDFGPNQQLNPGESNLLGAKLHVWNDLGPMGFTYHETADEIAITLPVIAQKLWGNKMSLTFNDFIKRADRLKNVPQVHDARLLENSKSSDPIIDIDFKKNSLPDAVDKQLIKLLTGVDSKPLLALDKHDFVQLNLKADELEQPWTLSFCVKRMDDSDTTMVLFESPYGTIFLNLRDKKSSNAGFGIARTVGYKEYAGDDGDFYYQIFNRVIPVNKWTQVTLTGGHNSCTLYINGSEIQSVEKQFVCPLKTIGSNSGHLSASVLLANLKVYSRVLNKEEIKALSLNSAPFLTD
ncbi:family 20 glycosylhydrolase [Mucilaginibacter sp. BT774]|uniref:family 20 glycosylhydrolase n=1 Tax=Mucilaginibacter sp. BT774 TaxID=3062276 RepID=UPI002674CA07|nr:family 20 glycosylhydrolase [Mucilaginibacter sp. BT774]MDO3627520.1 family 20 glycosylhydrolase [Mucilaginibacter sp. BT774]